MANYSCLSSVMVSTSVWKRIEDVKQESQELTDATGCMLYRYAVDLAAQTFTPSVSHLLGRIDLYFTKIGYGEAVYTVTIRTTESGLPTNTILATGYVASYPMSGAAWKEVILDNRILVEADVTYAIVITSLGYVYDYLCWNGSLSDEYVGGSSYKYFGGVWTADEFTPDYAFREYKSALSMPYAIRNITRTSLIQPTFVNVSAFKAFKLISSTVQVGISQIVSWQSMCIKAVTDLFTLNDTITIRAYLEPIEEDISFNDTAIFGKDMPDFWLEVRNGSGQALAVLENAYNINISEKLTEIPMISFSLPADDDKADYLIPSNWIWVHQKNMPVKVFALYKDANKR